MTLLIKRKMEGIRKITALTVILLMIISLIGIMYPINRVDAASYSVTISPAKSEIKIGSSVQLTANTGGASGSFEYDFLYTLDNKTAYYISKWSKSNTCIFKPTEFERLKNYTGPIYVLAHARLNGSDVKTSPTKTINIMPKDDELLRVTGDVKSAGTYIVGESLIVTLTSSGGKSPYKYKYEYCQAGGAYKTLKDWSNVSSMTISTDGWTANKEYSIKATVKDDDGNTFSYVSIVKLKAKAEPNPTISSFSVPSAIEIGETVKLNCDVTSGVAPYQYKFTYIDTKNEEKTIADYGKNDNANWKTSSLTEGNYTVKVYIKDKNNKTASQKATVSVKKKTYPTLVNNSTINKTEFYLGEKLVVQASASGGSGNYHYKYEMCDIKGNCLKEQKYVNDTTFSYNVDSSTDTYIMRVTIEDTTTKQKAVKNLTFAIKDKEYPALVINPTLTKTPKNVANNTSGGDELEIQVTAQGGSGSYQYQYSYIKDGGEEETFGENPAISDSLGGMQDNANFTAKFLQPGKYLVKVYLYDVGRTDGKQVFVFRTYNITIHQAPKYTKGELDSLITSVENWYNRLTPTQKQVFNALNDVSSTDHFEYADWSTALENAKKVLNSGSEYEVDAVYEELKKQQDSAEKQDVIASEASSILFSVSSSLSNLLNWLLEGIGNLLTQSFGTNSTTSVFGGFDIKGFVDTYSPIFMIFANTLLVLLFGVNVISSAVQYELFTLRGAAKTLGHLFLAKVWIDLSGTICLAIIGIAGELLTQIITKAHDIIKDINFSFAFTYHSDIWLVGQVIDFIVMALVMIIIFLMFIPLLFFLVKVIVKLFIMNFELAALSAMSPVFFACLVGEETKQYFKNFMMTFLSVIVEVVFMGIVYAAFINWYSGLGDLSSAMDLSNLDISSQITNFAIFAIVFIAACSLMIKPPQVFKNLIR